jgi:hypothetical protein
MLIKDLISKLESIYEEQKPFIEIMGEPEIMIDIFMEAKDNKHLFRYAGLSRNIKLEYTPDGVYNIISSFEEEK